MPIRILLAAVLLMLAAPAQALIYSVGSSPACTHTSIAAALAAAEAHAGADTVRITRERRYTGTAITFTTSQDLTITGGFASCTAAEDGIHTTLDGAGAGLVPVVNVAVGTSGIVRLRKLTITGGNRIDPLNRIRHSGGGIFFYGNGILDIGDTTVSNNRAAYGGGIAAYGTGASAELILRASTYVTFNTASYDGGGLLLRDIETTIEDDSTWILENTATGVGQGGGYGGGIGIESCSRDSILYLGSPGVGGAGVVSGNTARHGGGVALRAVCGDTRTFGAQLRMYSTHATRLTRISDNVARAAGGGIYAELDDGGIDGTNPANLYVLNASVTGNQAPEGAALQLAHDNDVGSGAYFNQPAAVLGSVSFPASALPCTAGAPCGRISDNISTNGRVIGGTARNRLLLARMALSGNRGTELIRLEYAQIADALIVDNETSARLIETVALDIRDSTIAGNAIGASRTLASAQSPRLEYLIHWQPGKTTLDYAGNPESARVHDIISNEIGSLVHLTNPRIYINDPRFVDPANGDYSPSAASPAVDFSPRMPPGDANDDLFSHNRSVDLTAVPNRNGPRDLGAIERQSLQPLVLNGSFLGDLRNWLPNEASTSIWDATQNGDSGGALRLSRANAASGQAVRPYTQCVNVPGPGTYRISALGRSTGFFANQRDAVRLHWEYRRYGNYLEGCHGTPTPDRSGEIVVTTGTSWVRGEDVIVIPPGEWTRFSSLLVVPEAVERGIDTGTGAGLGTLGWIDGVRLEPVDEIIPGDVQDPAS